jgi:ribosome-binding protein aMBF1 (putative translation factor)
LKKTRTTSAPAAKKANKAPKPPTNKPFAERFPPSASPAAKALAANVRRLREELGLSQAKLADKANVKAGQAAIGLLELARSNPTLSMIEALARALKTTSAALLS